MSFAKSSSSDHLHAMRHTAAHVLAAAVMQLYPEAKLGVGPVVENGFYYDILLPQPLTPDDLKKIEKVMHKIINRGEEMRREEMNIKDAIKFFQERKQDFKVELLTTLQEKGTTKVNTDEQQDIDPKNKEVASVYWTGDFVDLCRGPHVANTKEVGAFKLDKIAGAYWRGDQSNPQLQRVYGLCFATEKELDAYLKMREEALKRDHRKIGQEQALFFIDDMVGKGLVMWQPNGTIIRNEIENLAIEMENKSGYARVSTPHLAKEELYLTSGHLPYYKDSMYPAMVMDDGTYYLRAMNCPHHHLIYQHSLHSYKELPIRLAEYGMVYRNELSGTLAGLLRVRGLAMNDAHIYCRKDQIKDEVKKVVELTKLYFNIFGLTDYWFRLSKWSPDHLEKYINEPENWNYTETVIREVLQEMTVPFVEADDEAAFYGPKIDVMFKSVIGREETMSTVQLDFSARLRFNLTYIDQTGKENNDVFVIHRAPLSTHERFTAFLIEHFAGVWPVWLAPVQVVVATVSDNYISAAQNFVSDLKKKNIRIELDDSHESIGKKVRNAEKQKIPYILVFGEKEAAGDDIMIRERGKKDQLQQSRQDFTSTLLKKIQSRTL